MLCERCLIVLSCRWLASPFASRAVEKLWTTRAKRCGEPAHANLFLRDVSEIDVHDGCGHRLRVALRLIPRARCVDQRPPLALAALIRTLRRTLARRRANRFHHGHRTVTVHRFEETIGGRAYLIEVTPVSNRWRAQLLRTPGVPTAMMPFYGPTPDDAARQLAAVAVAGSPSGQPPRTDRHPAESGRDP